MRPTVLEVALHEASRRAVVQVVRSHPEWTLADLCEHIDGHGPGARLLASLSVRELRVGGTALEPPPDSGPLIQVGRLERAKMARGHVFDEIVVEVLAEASQPVAAGYLRARVGGPRWKLQSSLRRLVANDVVVRTGTTSATLYRPAGRR